MAYFTSWYRAKNRVFQQQQAVIEQLQLTVDSHAGQIRQEAETIQNHRQQIAQLREEMINKDYQLDFMSESVEPRQRMLRVYMHLAQQAFSLVTRAKGEIESHHDVCVQSQPQTLYISLHGRVWHFDGGCYHIHGADVRPVNPCTSCSCHTVTPYRTDVIGITLSQQMNDFLTRCNNIESWMNESDD